MTRRICKTLHCYNSVSNLVAGDRCALHYEGRKKALGPIASLRAAAAKLPEAQTVLFNQKRAEGFTLKDALLIAQRDAA